ncbi:MAG: ABC transporter ATP-binding protein [Cellulomonadaceae bacterium]|nr:ABC transporter ATP-binding protein [Cellulomonadaceae bacterium]
MTPSAGITERKPLMELREVSRTYDAAGVRALDRVSLTIGEGEYVSVIGASGSGKSTLLHVLGLLDRPSEGDYLFDGISTGALSEAALSKLRGGRIGFVFQAFHLIPHRTVLENVLLATVYSGVPRRERRERALHALERVHMLKRADFLPIHLSGGERQRAAVARAVVASPRVLFADEPTGNLDTLNSVSVLDLFDDLHASGLTLVVVTHDAAVSARAQRRIAATDGHVVEME